MSGFTVQLDDVCVSTCVFMHSRCIHIHSSSVTVQSDPASQIPSV